MRLTLGDRREGVRFAVGGGLWASLQLDAEVVVRNLTPRGALVEGRRMSPLNAVPVVRVSLSDSGPTLDAVVRHVTPVSGSTDRGERCLVGLEFINVSPEARADVERLLSDWQDQAGF